MIHNTPKLDKLLVEKKLNILLYIHMIRYYEAIESDFLK